MDKSYLKDLAFVLRAQLFQSQKPYHECPYTPIEKRKELFELYKDFEDTFYLLRKAENDELQEYYDSLLHTVNLIGARTQEVGQNTATYSYLGDHLLKGRMDRVEYQWHRYICKYTTYLTIKKSLQFQFKKQRWYNAWLTWIEEKIYLSAMEKELNIIADKYRKEHSKLISYAKKLLKEKKIANMEH